MKSKQMKQNETQSIQLKSSEIKSSQKKRREWNEKKRVVFIALQEMGMKWNQINWT